MPDETNNQTSSAIETPAPQVPIVDDKRDLTLSEIVSMATDELLASRKRELSNQISKLFHKADQLNGDLNKARREVDKTEKKLTKTLSQIERLRSGDWTVLKELNEKDKQEEGGK